MVGGGVTVAPRCRRLQTWIGSTKRFQDSIFEAASSDDDNDVNNGDGCGGAATTTSWDNDGGGISYDRTILYKYFCIFSSKFREKP